MLRFHPNLNRLREERSPLAYHNRRRPLPRPIVISKIMTLENARGRGALVHCHLPAEHRGKGSPPAVVRQSLRREQAGAVCLARELGRAAGRDTNRVCGSVRLRRNATGRRRTIRKRSGWNEASGLASRRRGIATHHAVRHRGALCEPNLASCQRRSGEYTDRHRKKKRDQTPHEPPPLPQATCRRESNRKPRTAGEPKAGAEGFCIA
jgi:hypothetical protein